eukprot:TRINITY_DN8993_c0_g1_i3.p1 TRINITY_DN8993_c0_g1~~TRINITY_DN8993_c0_g1_i3.p1  ORF type:complete len:702 (+),score=165.61 TRINITY_DN8993_c0_g1_i3:42-2147(+)
MSRRRHSSLDISLTWFEDQALFLPPSESDAYREAVQNADEFDTSASLIGRFQAQYGKVQLIALLWKFAQGRSTLKRNNWKRRYFVITDRVLLYAFSNPLLSADKGSIKCVIKLAEIESIDTVDHTMFGHAWVVCIQHKHALHIDCNGISPSVFTSVLKRGLTQVEDVKTMIVDGFVSYRYSPMVPRLDKEVQANNRNLDLLHDASDVVLLLDLAYFHNVDDWMVKLSQTWGLVQEALQANKADRIPDYAMLVTMAEVSGHDVVYVCASADQSDDPDAMVIAQRTELRDAWVTMVAEQHVGTDASWRLNAEGPTARVWMYTPLIESACGMEAYREWLSSQRYAIAQRCTSMAVWEGCDLLHIDQCMDQLEKVEHALHDILYEAPRLIQSMASLPELGLLQPKFGSFARHAPSQIEMMVAKAAGAKLILPLRKPSLKWNHASGDSFSGPLQWATEAAVYTLQARGLDESALHNPTGFTGFSPVDLLAHTFTSSGVDYEASLYWLILAGHMGQLIRLPAIYQHCRTVAQAADLANVLPDGDAFAADSYADLASLALVAALEIANSECDQLYVIMVALLVMQQLFPTIEPPDVEPQERLSSWLKRVYEDRGPPWLTDEDVDLQTDVQAMQQSEASDEGCFWLGIDGAVGPETQPFVSTYTQGGLVLLQSDEGLRLKDGFVVTSSKTLADWNLDTSLQRVSISKRR